MANLFISRWKLHPERRDEFRQIMDGLVNASKDLIESEITIFFHGWGRDENEFVAIESWRSEGAVKSLRETPEFQATMERLMACCREPMEMELFTDDQNDREIFELYPAGVSQVHPIVDAMHARFL